MMSEYSENSREHKLVMYTSPNLLSQVFRKYSDNVTKILKRNSTTTKKEVGGGLSGVIAKFQGKLSEQSGEEVIEEVNFTDEYRQVRALINLFADTNLVYSTEDLIKGNESPTGLYHFDTHLQLLDDEKDGNDIIRVKGIDNSVYFEGNTSTENWGSRSFIRTARQSTDPFPFEGVFLPVEVDHRTITESDRGKEIDRLEITVQFLYILSPDTEDYIDWSNFQILKQDN